MQNIKIITQYLSQYHGGQIVEMSAHICRDLDGVWHAIVRRYDRSDQTTDIEHTQHETRTEADKAISAAGLIVSHEQYTNVNLRRANRIKSALAKAKVYVSVSFDPVTLDANVDGEQCEPTNIEWRLEQIARDNLGVELGQWHYPNYGDGEFQVDKKKTYTARKTIENAIKMST
jgi:hypothetical protein